MVYKVGDTAFLVESNRFIREGTIIRVSGDLYMFRFKEGGGIQVKGHRLYPTKEEAEQAIKTPKRAF